MRNIKYRAWDKTMLTMNYKVLVGNTDIYDENYTCNGILIENKWMNADENCVDLMQYIGRKDTTNKDVYEGDIVDVEDGADGMPHEMKAGRYIVKYSAADAAFCLEQLDGKHSVSFYECMALTVVGNVYENKEPLIITP